MRETTDTLGNWISNAEDKVGEDIKTICIGDYEDGTKQHTLTREQWLLDPWFRQKFDNGFDGPECPSICAWTDNWIFYVHEYDGSTWLQKLPRNPLPGMELGYYGDADAHS